ncbi:MAG: hypothetical protein FWF72_03415 [Paludibacter sp.]|nr:hypothetical protein [Paludibacter sp.]
MHKSKYTFLFKENKGKYYIYNTLSNALVETDETVFTVLENRKENLAENNFDKETYKILPIILTNR